MKMWTQWRPAGGLLALALAACGTATPRPASSPEPAGPAAASPATSATPATGAGAATGHAGHAGHAGDGTGDVRFMQGMIAHHAQALEMTALVPTRSRRDDLRLLAARIEASQRDEIALMQRWLRTHGQGAPAAGAGHEHHGAGGHASMPGMLTPQELARLAAATGPEFDRLFLEYMIRHHEGALQMVAELFATPGAGQEPEAFRLASDVDADQRAEIARMRRLLSAPAAGANRR